MTAALDRCDEAPTYPTDSPDRLPGRDWLRRPLWNRFTPLQCLVLAVGAIAPVVILGNLLAGLFGVLSTEAMIENVLVAGEDPGMLTFGAMLLASPVQWWTGRTQVRVRKYLGIVFFVLALSNGAMFVLESGIGAVLSEPFLIAGTLAVAIATPLFLTSSRWSQRAMGLRRWRLLHKATYAVAVALIAHVLLIGELGTGIVIIAALALRLPPVRRYLQRRGED